MDVLHSFYFPTAVAVDAQIATGHLPTSPDGALGSEAFSLKETSPAPTTRTHSPVQQWGPLPRPLAHRHGPMLDREQRS
jgi:hypothetical protein